MDFTFNEEQEELRATARSFLEDQAGSEEIRKAMESDLGYDPELWKQIGTELGWPSVHIPEEYGGLGLDLTTSMLVSEKLCGCASFAVTLGAHAGIGTLPIAYFGNEAQKQEHLPRLAEGQLRASLALTEPAGRWDAAGIEAVFRREGDGFRLSGAKRFVPDGHCADLFVVAARSG